MTEDEPTPDRIIGTQEFADKYKALLVALGSARCVDPEDSLSDTLLPLIDAAIMQAHWDGFDEGVSK